MAIEPQQFRPSANPTGARSGAIERTPTAAPSRGPRAPAPTLRQSAIPTAPEPPTTGLLAAVNSFSDSMSRLGNTIERESSKQSAQLAWQYRNEFLEFGDMDALLSARDVAVDAATSNRQIRAINSAQGGRAGSLFAAEIEGFGDPSAASTLEFAVERFAELAELNTTPEYQEALNRAAGDRIPKLEALTAIEQADQLKEQATAEVVSTAVEQMDALRLSGTAALVQQTDPEAYQAELGAAVGRFEKGLRDLGLSNEEVSDHMFMLAGEAVVKGMPDLAKAMVSEKLNGTPSLSSRKRYIDQDVGDFVRQATSNRTARLKNSEDDYAHNIRVQAGTGKLSPDFFDDPLANAVFTATERSNLVIQNQKVIDGQLPERTFQTFTNAMQGARSGTLDNIGWIKENAEEAIGLYGSMANVNSIIRTYDSAKQAAAKSRYAATKATREKAVTDTAVLNAVTLMNQDIGSGAIVWQSLRKQSLEAGVNPFTGEANAPVTLSEAEFRNKVETAFMNDIRSQIETQGPVAGPDGTPDPALTEQKIMTSQAAAIVDRMGQLPRQWKDQFEIGTSTFGAAAGTSPASTLQDEVVLQNMSRYRALRDNGGDALISNLSQRTQTFYRTAELFSKYTYPGDNNAAMISAKEAMRADSDVVENRLNYIETEDFVKNMDDVLQGSDVLNPTVLRGEFKDLLEAHIMVGVDPDLALSLTADQMEAQSTNVRDFYIPGPMVLGDPTTHSEISEDIAKRYVRFLGDALPEDLRNPGDYMLVNDGRAGWRLTHRDRPMMVLEQSTAVGDLTVLDGGELSPQLAPLGVFTNADKRLLMGSRAAQVHMNAINDKMASDMAGGQVKIPFMDGVYLNNRPSLELGTAGLDVFDINELRDLGERAKPGQKPDQDAPPIPKPATINHPANAMLRSWRSGPIMPTNKPSENENQVRPTDRPDPDFVNR